MLNAILRTVCLLGLLFLSPAVLALDGFPPSINLPKDVSVNSSHSLNYDQAEFLVAGQQTTKQGKLTSAFLVIAFEEGHRPTAETTWKAWEPQLLKSTATDE